MQLYNYEKFTTPSRQGDRYVFRHNTGLQNQYVLKLQETLDADAVTILDPNTLSEDGTIALGSVSFTEDGSTMAYTLSSGGSDWVEIHFLRIGVNGETEKLPDVLKHVKFTSLEWTHDGEPLSLLLTVSLPVVS